MVAGCDVILGNEEDAELYFGIRPEGMDVTRGHVEGAEFESVARQLMVRFRNQPPVELAGSPLVTIKDYETLTEKNLITGEEKTIRQKTTSDVLQFFTASGTKISIRPSGTEPKIKFYFEVKGELKSRQDYDEAEEKADRLIDSMMAELGL